VDLNVRAAFEEASTAQLQAAVDAAEGRPEVTDIWIYTSFAGPVSPSALYGGEAGVVEAFDLDSLLAEPVGSRTRQWQMALGRGLMGPAVDLVQAYSEAGAEVPTRIVVHYSVVEQSMDATFSYNQLDPEILDPVPLFEKWFENARATGDFSADATTVGA
jgi:hypothetical protein